MFNLNKNNDKELTQAIRDVGVSVVDPLRYYLYIITHIRLVIFQTSKDNSLENDKVKREVYKYFQRNLDLASKVDNKLDYEFGLSPGRALFMKSLLNLSATTIYTSLMSAFDNHSKKGELVEEVYFMIYASHIIITYFENDGNLFDENNEIIPLKLGKEPKL